MQREVRHEVPISFPTRRSSDLVEESGPEEGRGAEGVEEGEPHAKAIPPQHRRQGEEDQHDAQGGDRKSTRLNSSHLVISYAVFCLKKKSTIRYEPSRQCATRTT